MERIWPRGFQTVCLREQMRERSRRAPWERCGTGKNAEVLFSARGGARCLQRTGDAAWRQTDRARALCAVRDVCLAGRDLCARAARRRVHVCTVRRSHLIKVGHTHASPSRPTPPTRSSATTLAEASINHRDLGRVCLPRGSFTMQAQRSGCSRRSHRALCIMHGRQTGIDGRTLGPTSTALTWYTRRGARAQNLRTRRTRDDERAQTHGTAKHSSSNVGKETSRGRAQHQSRAFLNASRISASGEPASGTCEYSHRAVSGSDIRMLSMRPPVLRPKTVPRS